MMWTAIAVEIYTKGYLVGFTVSQLHNGSRYLNAETPAPSGGAQSAFLHVCKNAISGKKIKFRMAVDTESQAVLGSVLEYHYRAQDVLDMVYLEIIKFESDEESAERKTRIKPAFHPKLWSDNLYHPRVTEYRDSNTDAGWFKYITIQA